MAVIEVRYDLTHGDDKAWAQIGYRFSNDECEVVARSEAASSMDKSVRDYAAMSKAKERMAVMAEMMKNLLNKVAWPDKMVKFYLQIVVVDKPVNKIFMIEGRGKLECVFSALYDIYMKRMK